MKAILIEEKITKKVWVACDGTRFSTEEECKKYDDSALGVLNARYTPNIVGRDKEYNLFGHGSEDYDVELVKVTSKEDVDTLLQLFYLHNPYLIKDKDAENHNHVVISTITNTVNKAFEDKDIVFVGRGYDNDNFWIYESKNQLIDRINKIGENKEE